MHMTIVITVAHESAHLLTKFTQKHGGMLVFDWKGLADLEKLWRMKEVECRDNEMQSNRKILDKYLPSSFLLGDEARV